MEAIYNLDRSPASFNFMEFLVIAKTLGATEIVLNDTRGYRKKYPAEDTKRRMETIIEPACALAGLPFKYGAGDGHSIDCGYQIKNVIRTYRFKGYIEKLKTVKPPVEGEATVTLRNYDRHSHRNSNADAWRKFAKDIGAVLIEDFYDKPIHLHDRMALYAGARMNYFVSNGPSELGMLSDYPYLAIYPQAEADFVKGYDCDFNFPWKTDQQRIVVAEDTYENIHKINEEWMEEVFA